MNLLIYIVVLINVIHAQIALPSFHGAQKPHTSVSSSGTFTFTNCGATGRTGPTQSQINSTYSSKYGAMSISFLIRRGISISSLDDIFTTAL